MTYQVKDWDKRFENNRTRELKEMNWFPIPNRFDGDGYTELVEGHRNGPAHYAAWVAICGVASRCDQRGTLLRDAARPHDSVSLARKTRLPQALFEEAIPRLIAIGWLVQKDNVNHCQQTIPQEGAIKSQEGAAKSHPIAMEWNGMEGKEGNEPKGGATASQVDAIYNAYPRKIDPEAAKKAIRAAIKRLTDNGTTDAAAYLLARTKAFAASPAGQKPAPGDKDYRKHPATWFNAGSYANEIDDDEYGGAPQFSSAGVLLPPPKDDEDYESDV